MKITIEWLGGEKIIPGYGFMVLGRIVSLPVEMGESFIKQGLAKVYKPKKTKLSKEVK